MRVPITALPRTVTRPISVLLVLAWLGQMALLVSRSSVHASGNLATDLANYGSDAQWRGVYYRGEKLGYTVSQTVPAGDGFELREDGELQMSLLGATTAARIHTAAQVDRTFALRGFEFSLDPGTGPISVSGRVEPSAGRNPGPTLLTLAVTTASGTRVEKRELAEVPQLAVNMARRLADGGLVPGARHQWTLFDPATLRNAPVIVDVGRREVVRAGDGRIPAFRVNMEFAGLRTTSWITDTGEVVREESPMGLVSIREPADRARSLAVPGQVRADLLAAAAIVPITKARIDDPRDVRRLRLRVSGADLSGFDLDGVGQTVDGDVIEIRDAQQITATRLDPDAGQYLAAEPFIEADAPEIRAEAQSAIRQVPEGRARAEALTRYVNALLEKKPTVSLPSAREVLRTRIGDCNEHTVLFVAMARSVGLPARIDVGLTYVHGAFYYHAWPEVYLTEGPSRGLWLPVDPTLNQFPADATHVRLTRGGLEKQALILPLIGRLTITVVDLDLAPGATPILIGQADTTAQAFAHTPPAARRVSRWCLPCLGLR